jgi:hypothetical protein
MLVLPDDSETFRRLQRAASSTRRPVSWFDGPVADLGRRRPHVTPPMLDLGDED